MHESINDHMAPSVEQIDKIISFIHDEISKKRPVTVHCAAGQGRTGTILASYILKHLSFNAEESIAKIRKLRPPSIEDSQEKSLYLYENYLQKTKG
jgi:atypical dual specificity phosphatase